MPPTAAVEGQKSVAPLAIRFSWEMRPVLDMLRVRGWSKNNTSYIHRIRVFFVKRTHKLLVVWVEFNNNSQLDP
eukprot:6281117-Amphidinium_carterae.1